MNIRELLETQAEKYGQKTFLYFEEEQISYRAFDLAANRAANGFRQLGIRKGDRIALMLPNCPAFLYTWMGLNKIGAVQLPINTHLTEAEVKYILQHSEASGVVIHQDYFPLLDRMKMDESLRLGRIVFCGDELPPAGTVSFSQFMKESEELPPVRISEEDPAVCIYTSGTTDRPKGVLNSHRNWVLTGEAFAFSVGITPEDRLMTPNPLFHANAQVYSTMGTLAAGASLILLPRFSASQILAQSRYYNASLLVLVQATTAWLWNQPHKANDGDNPLRKIIAGGVPIEIYHPFEERFRLRIQRMYSLTEAVMGIMAPPEGSPPGKEGGIGFPMKLPDPLMPNEIKIVDEDGLEVPKGRKGEIVIRNPATMIGYLKDEARTAEAKKEGWIFTGDLGVQDEDGYFYFLGRKKEVIRRRGELISPAEIEAAINSHSSVQESAVIGIPSGLGTGEEEVKAFVIRKPNEALHPREIVTWCEARLANFKIPRFIEFRDDFPRNALGRIQKNQLKGAKQNQAEGCYDRLKK